MCDDRASPFASCLDLAREPGGWVLQGEPAPVISRWPVGDQLLYNARQAELQLALDNCSEYLVTLTV
eukprot:SAG22_NODE_8458_length_654_cov_1.318919_2_plen_66_part_01